MSYRYNVGEDTEQEIKRIIKERFERSIKEFQDENQDISRANHQMRKNMKKVRGALRLVRKSIGKEDYKSRNVAARDIARKGAELRESYAALQTLDKLKERFGSELDPDSYQIARRMLEADYRRVKRELPVEDFLPAIIENLEDGKTEVADLTIEDKGFDAFEKGLKKVYKRGRKAKKKALRDPTPENYHEWRKRVKYFWYHIRILRNIWPGELKSFAKEIHNLSDYLGDDHDLYDLKNRIYVVMDDSIYEKERKHLSRLILELSNEKRQKARFLGEKIYAEKPKLFVSRIKKYWKIAHRELEQSK